MSIDDVPSPSLPLKKLPPTSPELKSLVILRTTDFLHHPPLLIHALKYQLDKEEGN
jgi:hypothetical protein